MRRCSRCFSPTTRHSGLCGNCLQYYENIVEEVKGHAAEDARYRARHPSTWWRRPSPPRAPWIVGLMLISYGFGYVLGLYHDDLWWALLQVPGVAMALL